MTATSITMPLGQVQVNRPGATFLCPGLGSCIGVVVLDPKARLCAAATIMLPKSPGHTETPGRYADLAIAQIVAKLEAEGADRTRLRAAIAGGAQAFHSQGACSDFLDMGKRTSDAVLEQFAKLGLTCVAQDLGGDVARTLKLDSSTGRVTVHTSAKGETLLCNLAE